MYSKIGCISLPIVYLICCQSATFAVSHIWGQTVYNAVPIFEKDIYWESPRDQSNKIHYVDFVYPEEGDRNDYTITTMLAFDEANNEQGTHALIVAGGIGFNYTLVRFITIKSDIYFNLLIYGIP